MREVRFDTLMTVVDYFYGGKAKNDSRKTMVRRTLEFFRRT